MEGEMALIVNPTAGNSLCGRVWRDIYEYLESFESQLRVFLTEYPEHATELVCQAVQSGCRKIVVIGGDGTIFEVVNGLISSDALLEVVLGIVPIGTGVDLRRTLGFSRDWKEACDRILKGQTKTLDLGKILCRREGRTLSYCFTNAAGIGFNVTVAWIANKYFKRFAHRLGPLKGTLPYIMGLLFTLFTYRGRLVTIEFDGQRRTLKINSVILANGRFFAGGILIAPDASPDDRKLDLIIAEDIGRLEMLYSAPRVLKGTHLSHPKVFTQQVRAVRVESEHPLLFQADGEIKGPSTEITFEVLPSALKVII